MLAYVQLTVLFRRSAWTKHWPNAVRTSRPILASSWRKLHSHQISICRFSLRPESWVPRPLVHSVEAVNRKKVNGDDIRHPARAGPRWRSPTHPARRFVLRDQRGVRRLIRCLRGPRWSVRFTRLLARGVRAVVKHGADFLHSFPYEVLGEVLSVGRGIDHGAGACNPP